MMRRFAFIGALLALAAPASAQMMGFFGTSAPPPVVTSISGPSIQLGTETAGTGYAEGWTAVYNGTAPSSVFQTFNITEAGFDTTGAATTYAKTITVTKALRNVYSLANSASFNPLTLRGDNLVALSSYVYAPSVDTVPAGITNNSTIIPPMPLCNWSMASRTNINGSVYVEAVCFHRDARNSSQVPYVKFTGTDVGAAHTGTCTATAMTASTYLSGQTNGDQNTVWAYGCTITAAWNAGPVTVNGIVKPWIGTAASVLDSSTISSRRFFSPRYFLQTTAAPVYAFICPASGGTGGCTGAGNDSTGIWHTTAATAGATPFLTWAQAVAAIDATRNSAMTGSKLDNLVIYIGAGGVAGGTSGSIARNQNVGALLTTRDPAATHSTAVLNVSVALRPRISASFTSPIAEGALIFKDMTINRTASVITFTGEAAANLEVYLQDVDMDAGGFGVMASNGGLNFLGVKMANVGTGASLQTQIRLSRGVVDQDSSVHSVEIWNTIGGDFFNAQFQTPSSGTADGAIFAFNKHHILNGVSLTTDAFSIVQSANLTTYGLARVQNLLEWANATTGSTSEGLSRDGQSVSTYNVINMYNTHTGWGILSGRENDLYDEHQGVPRFHKLASWKNNLDVMVYMKADWFVGHDGNGSANPTDAPNHTGNFAPLYGVDVAGEYLRFADVGSDGGVGPLADRMFIYAGPGAVIPTSATVETNDPKFHDYRSTTFNGTNLVGGTATIATPGDYSLDAGSACIGAGTTPLLPGDIAGNVRPRAGQTQDSCGASR